MHKIVFSYNWNNKLHCPCHTTIRLRNDKKYVIGQRYAEYGQGNRYMSDVIIVNIKHFKLSQINDYIAMLDTGYDRNETISIIKKMYKNKSVDYDNQQFSLILLKRVNPEQGKMNM